MTVVNKITVNLFLRQRKGIDDYIQKEKNSNFEIRNAIYRCKPKLISSQPIILNPIRDVAIATACVVQAFTKIKK